MDRPKRIGNIPALFNFPTLVDFTGLEFRDVFDPACPSIIRRINVTANNGAYAGSFSVEIQIRNVNSDVVYTAWADAASAGAYGWHGHPLYLGAGEYLGILTDELAGQGVPGGDAGFVAEIAEAR